MCLDSGNHQTFATRQTGGKVTDNISVAIKTDF
jgi:hypothetical protein